MSISVTNCFAKEWDNGEDRYHLLKAPLDKHAALDDMDMDAPHDEASEDYSKLHPLACNSRDLQDEAGDTDGRGELYLSLLYPHHRSENDSQTPYHPGRDSTATKMLLGTGKPFVHSVSFAKEFVRRTATDLLCLRQTPPR